jgi:hypothetical protein
MENRKYYFEKKSEGHWLSSNKKSYMTQDSNSPIQ